MRSKQFSRRIRWLGRRLHPKKLVAGAVRQKAQTTADFTTTSTARMDMIDLIRWVFAVDAWRHFSASISLKMAKLITAARLCPMRLANASTF